MPARWLSRGSVCDDLSGVSVISACSLPLWEKEETENSHPLSTVSGNDSLHFYSESMGVTNYTAPHSCQEWWQVFWCAQEDEEERTGWPLASLLPPAQLGVAWGLGDTGAAPFPPFSGSQIHSVTVAKKHTHSQHLMGTSQVKPGVNLII